MNNGGQVARANVWQVAVAAGAITSEATVQNTSLGTHPNEYDPNGINDGPPVLVWPYAANPNDLNGDGTNKVAGLGDGALLCRRPGDAIKFTNTQTGAIYVTSTRDGATFAVSSI